MRCQGGYQPYSPDHLSTRFSTRRDNTNCDTKDVWTLRVLNLPVPQRRSRCVSLSNGNSAAVRRSCTSAIEMSTSYKNRCGDVARDRAQQVTRHIGEVRVEVKKDLHTCLAYVWLAALVDSRGSLGGRLTSFVQTIDVHTGFNAPAIRVTERHDRGAIDAVQFAAGALQCLWRKLW